MRILDRYILLEYLKMFMIIILSFSTLFIIVDVFERLPKLMQLGAPFLDSILYFMTRLPYLFVLTSPVAVLLSGLFLMNTLSKYNESIAIRAAGISILRMFAPLFWFSLLFSVFILWFGESVLPNSVEYRDYLYNVRIKGKEREDIRMRSNIYYRGEDNHLYYIGFFDGYRNRLKTIDISQFDDDTGQIKKKIQAAEAIWEEDHWILNDCYIYYFENGKPLMGDENQSHFASTAVPELSVKPEEFVKRTTKTEAMSYFELRDYIQRLKKVGETHIRELTDLHFKLSFPFSNLIIIFFSVPLASTSTRAKGRGLVFLLGVAICFLYLTALRFSMSLGYNGVLSPVVAAWAANVLFFGVGIGFIIKAEV